MEEHYLFFILLDSLRMAQSFFGSMSGPGVIQKSHWNFMIKSGLPTLKDIAITGTVCLHPRETRSSAVSVRELIHLNGLSKSSLNYMFGYDSACQVFNGEREMMRAIRDARLIIYLPLGIFPWAEWSANSQSYRTSAERRNWMVKSYFGSSGCHIRKRICIFYIDPETFQMEKRINSSGRTDQRARLSIWPSLSEFRGLKIPANRSWYRTENNEFLGGRRARGGAGGGGGGATDQLLV